MDLAAIANDRSVVMYLSTRIPHPYTLENAVEWIAIHQNTHDPSHFAVESDGELIGAIGYDMGSGSPNIFSQSPRSYVCGRTSWNLIARPHAFSKKPATFTKRRYDRRFSIATACVTTSSSTVVCARKSVPLRCE